MCVTVGGDADLRVPSGCDNLIPNNHLTLSHTGLLVNAQRSVSKSLTGQKVKPAASRPAPPPPTWKTSILSHFLIPEKGGLFFWNNLALKCSNFCHFSKAYFLALFRLKMVHFLSFFIKLFFRTHFYFVFDRIRACSCQKRVCFHVGRFIRNFLCVFIVLCVNLLCVTVGGGRRSARVFRGVTTFPPLLTLPQKVSQNRCFPR